MLARKGNFGPLMQIFPEQGEKWARSAGVDVSNCVAFKAEHNGIRAEVVLAMDGDEYKVVRVNNVKQLGMEGL